MKLAKLQKALAKGEIKFYCKDGFIMAQDAEGNKIHAGTVSAGYIIQELAQIAPYIQKTQEEKQ